MTSNRSQTIGILGLGIHDAVTTAAGDPRNQTKAFRAKICGG
jgi:hypothetical protein